MAGENQLKHKSKSKWKEVSSLLFTLAVDDLLTWTSPEGMKGITAVRMFAASIAPLKFKTVTHKNKLYIIRVE